MDGLHLLFAALRLFAGRLICVPSATENQSSHCQRMGICLSHVSQQGSFFPYGEKCPVTTLRERTLKCLQWYRGNCAKCVGAVTQKSLLWPKKLLVKWFETASILGWLTHEANWNSCLKQLISWGGVPIFILLSASTAPPSPSILWTGKENTGRHWETLDTGRKEVWEALK